MFSFKNFNFNFDSYNVIFEIYIGNKLASRQNMQAPKEMLMLSFMQTVNDIANDNRPIKLKMIRQEDEKRAKNKICNVLCGQKKSYNGYIYRYYKEDYPQIINVTKKWKVDLWRKEKK